MIRRDFLKRGLLAVGGLLGFGSVAKSKEQTKKFEGWGYVTDNSGLFPKTPEGWLLVKSWLDYSSGSIVKLEREWCVVGLPCMHSVAFCGLFRCVAMRTKKMTIGDSVYRVTPKMLEINDVKVVWSAEVEEEKVMIDRIRAELSLPPMKPEQFRNI